MAAVAAIRPADKRYTDGYMLLINLGTVVLAGRKKQYSNEVHLVIQCVDTYS